MPMAATLNATADLLRVLGNENRLRLLQALADRELCVCELVDALGRAHYAVSRDLAALQKVGLIRERRVGSWVYHSIAPEAQADPFRADLLRLVGRRLAGSPEAQADEARLARRLALRDGDRCVVAVADFTTQAPIRVDGTFGRN
jgi:ArsR family transcriptional regulator